ncbi:hypothetical protein C8A05DRAFT_30777 [Staphylotrichum tortipilum]|uniref:Calcium influx-promoting protein ehs1 n=1 Tax=Staphylotrichum tortipilum TaxID=2831512 RepID=A0AAN6MQW4_9PEZI|nr:hypothetical protein C8A05DRAFT_30777 [Staphylotrichum longicolle]
MVHLSPLQSRLAASLLASILLFVLYLVLFPPNFALAAELKQALPIVFDDLDDIDLPPPDYKPRGPLDPTYEPKFAAFERSILGRAPSGVTALTNNEAMPMNVEAGTTQRFVFSLPSVSGRGPEGGRLELRSDQVRDAGAGAGAGIAEYDEEDGGEAGQSLARRQASQRVYISANTCQQPQPVDPSKTTTDPPQLTLYVSTSAENQAPGPLADKDDQEVVVFEEGAAVFNLTTNKEVYIGVHAPNATTAFRGIYNFRVAASVYHYFYNYKDQDDLTRLTWVDSDSQGALLMTQNLTESEDSAVQQRIMSSQPYVLFAHNMKDRAINGVKNSFCGLQTYAQIAAIKDGRRTDMVRTVITKRGAGNFPKQQFFFNGLNSSADYIGILVSDGSALTKRQVGQTATAQGIEVFKPTNFTTKSDHGNCALIVDLNFCDQIAYSVPSNPSFGNSSRLASFYDDYAAAMYANFNKSLAQIACEAPASQRYSLARTCDDCAAAYKDWLCSVVIPRCEDFSNAAPYLQPRAVGQPFPDGTRLDPKEAEGLPNNMAFNSSRNPMIDEFIQPGPYKELLPCDDLCYKLVQNCPAAMGFGCPLPGDIGFDGNYAKHLPTGGLTCNFPGSAHVVSAGERAAVVGWGVLVGVVGLGLGFLLA